MPYETFPDDGIERSYGIVPLRFFEDGRIEVLIIQHSSNGETGFPKGHAEPSDKDPLAAARRELMEETGIDHAEILFDPNTGYLEQSYTNPRTSKEKKVVLWPAEIKNDAQVTIQPEEISRYNFVNINDARAEMTHQLDRDVIARVIRLLSIHKSENYP